MFRLARQSDIDLVDDMAEGRGSRHGANMQKLVSWCGLGLTASILAMVFLMAPPTPLSVTAASDGCGHFIAIDDEQPRGSAPLSFYTDWPARRDRSQGPLAACFAEGTDPAVVEMVTEMLEADLIGPRYNLTSRWSGGQGTPRALTWSFVPDGLSIPSGIGEGTAPSNLFAQMDAKFAASGGRATWVARFQQSFDRWAQLTGLSYTRITVGGDDWDDGAVWGSSGAAGLRGDIRICMKPIDGANGVLAYNNFPSSGGDMVLDSGETWNSGAANLNRFLRNTVMHEHGHGIGMLHVCPAPPTLGGGTKLMEPFLSTSFDGPQHDDVRGGQRHYGDANETNGTAATATPVGTVEVGSPLTIGTAPPPTFGASPAFVQTTSIDGTADNDWYRFSVNGLREATVTVTPVGGTYDSCSQSGSSCPTGCPVNSLAIANLNVQVVATNGITVLATAAVQPAGSAETISAVTLPAAGDYYIRVYSEGSFTQSQLYTVTASVTIPCTPPSVNAIPAASRACGSPFSFLATAGGTAPFTWSLSGQPAGMTINPGTGQIDWPSPVPSISPYAVTVQADSQCGGGSDSKVLVLTVAFGDFDGDGIVGPVDLPIFIDHLLGLSASNPCAADMNSSGIVDGDDIQLFVDAIIP